MKFLPRSDLLSLEEIGRLCAAFVERGTRRLRITGGEPLVRRDIIKLFRSLSRHLVSGALDELTMTTNGSQLSRFAAQLADSGVRRINVSLDTLNADRFREVTRGGCLSTVLRGIDAAQAAGLSVRINTVALKGFNEDDFLPIILWSHGRGMDVALIEVMPLGETGMQRANQYLPLEMVKKRLDERLTLTTIDHKTAGPARYVRVAETGGRLGLIAPHTHNFCESCNRVRVTCAGILYMCLGQNDAVDLRIPLRASKSNHLLNATIEAAIARKPKEHDFVIQRPEQPTTIARHMSATGG